MDLKAIQKSFGKFTIKISFIFFWIILIGNTAQTLLSNKSNSEKMESLAWDFVVYAVMYALLSFSRIMMRNM